MTATKSWSPCAPVVKMKTAVVSATILSAVITKLRGKTGNFRDSLQSLANPWLNTLRVQAEIVAGDMASTENLLNAKMVKSQKACAPPECIATARLKVVVNTLVKIPIGGATNTTTTMQFIAAICNTFS